MNIDREMTLQLSWQIYELKEGKKPRAKAFDEKPKSEHEFLSSGLSQSSTTSEQSRTAPADSMPQNQQSSPNDESRILNLCESSFSTSLQFDLKGGDIMENGIGNGKKLKLEECCQFCSELTSCIGFTHITSNSVCIIPRSFFPEVVIQF